MTSRTISYYNDISGASHSDADQLVLEVCAAHIACLVKGATSGEVEALEIFTIEAPAAEWNEIFHQIKTQSLLLNRTYHDIHCYYNFEEALLVPQYLFTASAAEDMLGMVYGESDRYEVKYDILNGAIPMVNVYRIKKTILEQVNRYFLLNKPHHIYSVLVQHVLTTRDLPEHFIKVLLYEKHFVAAVVKDGLLQLVQSFAYATQADALYHLANLSRQFSLDPKRSHLEISGKFDTGSELHKQLQTLFGLISFESTEPDGIFKTAGAHPLHYFTPFYKLVV
ncbi:MAG: DUF3822 family protein [Bacteroidetes bacterium]|nr:DUF3822 family protein [Bacteroidota bacterium]